MNSNLTSAVAQLTVEDFDHELFLTAHRLACEREDGDKPLDWLQAYLTSAELMQQYPTALGRAYWLQQLRLAKARLIGFVNIQVALE